MQNLNHGQRLKIRKMESIHNQKDKSLNQFKLMIYNWNIDDAIKYYNNDSFCYDYCIDEDYKYGCRKQENKCPFEHSKTMTLYNLIHRNSNTQQDYKMAKLLCLYLMNKKIYNENNSQLFMYYGDLLRKTGTTRPDYLKCEKYFVTSLNIDNNNGYAHNNYAILLELKLNSFNKAEYHFKKALEIDPNNAVRNYNFALFLKNRQKKYTESLIYCNKACKLQPNNSRRHELKGEILYLLNNFEESIDETVHALKLNKNDGYMNDDDLNHAKQLIEESIKKYMIEKLKMKYYSNNKEFEGYKLIEWLYDNQLLSIKSAVFSYKISLSMLTKFNNLLSDRGLSSSDKVKFRNAVLSFHKMEPNEFEDDYRKTQLKCNEMAQQVEHLKQENKKLKQVEFLCCLRYLICGIYLISIVFDHPPTFRQWNK